MIRFAVSCVFLAAAVWFCGIYKMGDKTLIGHLREVYETPLVQQKVSDFQKGVGQRINGTQVVTVEKSKHVAKPRPMAAVEPTPAPVVDARPQTGEKQKAPAHDNLTQEDRQNLDDLVAKKLHK